jgi:hypothetical protein
LRLYLTIVLAGLTIIVVCFVVVVLLSSLLGPF